MLHVLNNVYVGVHSRSLIAHSACILAYISMLVQGWHLLETQQETFLVKHGILLDLLLSKNDSKKCRYDSFSMLLLSHTIQECSMFC